MEDDDDEDEMSPEAEDAWCQERREHVEAYLAEQQVEHGDIPDWPAWHIAPYVSVWPIESRNAPGWVGWWVISGDLPADYCSAGDCDFPRLAVRKIAQNWRVALNATKPGDETIGQTGLPLCLFDLLTDRADMLMDMTEDAALWED